MRTGGRKQVCRDPENASGKQPHFLLLWRDPLAWGLATGSVTLHGDSLLRTGDPTHPPMPCLEPSMEWGCSWQVQWRRLATGRIPGWPSRTPSHHPCEYVPGDRIKILFFYTFMKPSPRARPVLPEAYGMCPAFSMSRGGV